jgi:putative DNA methylase
VNDDQRLIEDILPIEAISAAASSEPRTKGHISTMHVWRARRPLVACRAAIFASLVPQGKLKGSHADENGRVSSTTDATVFLKSLATYPGPAATIREAETQIMTAHAERLSTDKIDVGQRSDPADEAQRPRVLDMFAGGGAIPLEAARLGCETHALDLNPVAFIIELCTVTFPQTFGASLADDVEHWARIALDRTKSQVADAISSVTLEDAEASASVRLEKSDSFLNHKRELTVVADYWTRTVPCPNPQCRGTVPLYRQTWLRRKPGRFVALEPMPDLERCIVRFQVVEADSEAALGFDPSTGSEGSSTTCPFCHATLTGAYVRKYGNDVGFGQQLMCVICQNPDGPGKVYLAAEALARSESGLQDECDRRASLIESELGPNSLDELIPPTGNAGLATGKSYLYGIRTFRQAFTPRQRLTLLALAREIRGLQSEMVDSGVDEVRARVISTYLGLWLSRLTDRCNALCRWNNARETIESLTSMKRFAMMWDFPEVNLFGGSTGDAFGNLGYITAAIRQESAYRNPVAVIRASATDLPYDDDYFDAVITDPPYYDNESYSELSDMCYVWLRLAIGFLYPQHFASQLTPKKRECVAAAYRQGGKDAAKTEYEECIFRSLLEARRVMKPGGILVTIYAHKTTMGWATLVDALRRAGFTVTEAWPLDTETKARVAHRGDAVLASSIFLVARKRRGTTIGSYATEVRPELEQIVQERVGYLWEKGISGADLVIACVGAGLRAFTRHAAVELANGDDVPAERFLAEVESVVLESILNRLSAETGGLGDQTLSGLDLATRFYILWRYTYRNAEVDAGEAIIFANGTHVELDGPAGLSYGSRALLLKKSGKDDSIYHLRDFSERGMEERLGYDNESTAPSSAIDILHRALWLMENRPTQLQPFLEEAHVNRDQLRLVAQALVGTALRGSEAGDAPAANEQVSLAKLIANWRSVIGEPTSRSGEQPAQASLFHDGAL